MYTGRTRTKSSKRRGKEKKEATAKRETDRQGARASQGSVGRRRSTMTREECPGQGKVERMHLDCSIE